MEAEMNSSKEDMLSGALSGSNNSESDSQPQQPDHPPVIHAPPINPSPNPQPIPTTLNNNNNNISSSSTGFCLVRPNAVVESDTSSQKKKRGRPRKYDADGNLRISYASPPLYPPPGFGSSPLQTTPFGLNSSQKMRKPMSSSGYGEMFGDAAALGDFKAHLVTVGRGEDVAGKILLLGQQGHKGICVLSAIGVVSNVTISQLSSSGGILTYEGRFEILSWTGQYTAARSAGGEQGWVGALSVSLAGPDGRVVGGSVAGSMTAASPTQLVLGSFTPGGYKRQKRKYVRQQPRPTPIAMNVEDAVTAAKPISQAMPAEDGFQSQSSPSLEHSHEEDEEPMAQQRPELTRSIWNFGPSPDINLPIHGRVNP